MQVLILQDFRCVSKWFDGGEDLRVEHRHRENPTETDKLNAVFFLQNSRNFSDSTRELSGEQTKIPTLFELEPRFPKKWQKILGHLASPKLQISMLTYYLNMWIYYLNMTT